MVTHNPELAEKYSTRIIRMLDGSLTDDSVPLTEKEVQLEQVQDQMSQEQEKDKKKPSMSFGTSFLLSLKNLELPKRPYCAYFLRRKYRYNRYRIGLRSVSGIYGIY